MNDPEVVIKIRNMNGVGPMVEPNPMFDPVDELSCDECNRPVGLTSTGVDDNETPIIKFYPYHITTPVAAAHPVILCFDCVP